MRGPRRRRDGRIEGGAVAADDRRGARHADDQVDAAVDADNLNGDVGEGFGLEEAGQHREPFRGRKGSRKLWGAVSTCYYRFEAVRRRGVLVALARRRLLTHLE